MRTYRVSQQCIRRISFVAFSFCVLFLSVHVSAYEINHNLNNLKGCFDIGYKFDDGKLIFKPEKRTDYNQTIFFIHNISYEDLMIKFDHTEEHQYFPMLTANINSNRWVAFVTDQQDLPFKCLNGMSDDYATEVNCENAVKVCQYPYAEFAVHNQGTYWIPVNSSKISARNHVIWKTGVLLRATPRPKSDSDDKEVVLDNADNKMDKS